MSTYNNIKIHSELLKRYRYAEKDNRWSLFWKTYYECNPQDWGIGTHASLNFDLPSSNACVLLNKTLDTFNSFISLLGNSQKY